jgi:hypothetical protein
MDGLTDNVVDRLDINSGDDEIYTDVFDSDPDVEGIYALPGSE